MVAPEMADDLAQYVAQYKARFCGMVRCEQCLETEPIDRAALERYSRQGWPRCHGRAMAWHTHLASVEQGWRNCA
jgi:hypothetical protein